jgi:hypothetical protein
MCHHQTKLQQTGTDNTWSIHTHTSGRVNAVNINSDTPNLGFSLQRLGARDESRSDGREWRPYIFRPIVVPVVLAIVCIYVSLRLAAHWCSAFRRDRSLGRGKPRILVVYIGDTRLSSFDYVVLRRI